MADILTNLTREAFRLKQDLFVILLPLSYVFLPIVCLLPSLTANSMENGSFKSSSNSEWDSLLLLHTYAFPLLPQTIHQ